jgi:homoserine kinase
VTGILAARGLVSDGAELLPDDAVLALATSLEGHPDNVAACLYGGLTISWVPELETPAVAAAGNGAGPVLTPPGPRVVRLPVLAEIRPVVFVAEESLATRTARDALPAAVPHRDAAANTARAALLVAALTRVPEVLFDATQDYLHQRYRAQVMPRTADLLGRLRAAGVAAMVSGAGPSVLALTVAGGPAGASPGRPDLVDSIVAETGMGWDIRPLAIDRQGATLQTAVPGERSRDSAR